MTAQLKGSTVVEAIRNAKTPGRKAQATKMLRQYVAQRTKQGFDPVMVEAGIKARVSRLDNGN